MARIDGETAERLFRLADSARWGLSLASFSEALERSLAKAPGDITLEGAAVERYLSGLHLRDLALAVACAAGVDSAWEHFVLEYRPALYRAADAIDPHGGARDLADSLYAELFGLRSQTVPGERQSLFKYFHGRSSLATWLRAVLAQRHVDRLRTIRRHEPVPDDESAGALVAREEQVEPERGRYLQLMKRGLSRAIAALEVRDRLRLACYYARELTLAETGRLLAEHEATTSRQLARTRKVIRLDVERQLREEQHLSEAEVERCFESVSEDAGPLNLQQIFDGGGEEGDGPGSDPGPSPPTGDRKKLARDRSRSEDIP